MSALNLPDTRFRWLLYPTDDVTAGQGQKVIDQPEVTKEVKDYLDVIKPVMVVERDRPPVGECVCDCFLLLDRSLMIGWRKNVCTWATEHTFWPRNLIWVKWSSGHEKNMLFLKEILFFTLFIGIFRFFPYITLVNLCFQATGHSFSCKNVIFGLREPCTIGNWRFYTFLKIPFFTVKGVIFSI